MDIQGRPGELVERLMALIEEAPDFYPNWWADAGVIVAAAIGGLEPAPLTDPPPPPGSAGAESLSRYGAAPRDQYMGLLRDRLLELVSLDVYEAFLVRALRDELARWITIMADTGGADERRTTMREDMRGMSEDPEALETYRESLMRRIPEVADWSDEQLVERLREMAGSSLLDPTTLDDAVDRWAAKSHFDRSTELLLSDAHIERWSSRTSG